MKPREFKERIEELLGECSDASMTHIERLEMIGIMEYAVFAFKLGYARSIERHNLQEAEGGETEFEQ